MRLLIERVKNAKCIINSSLHSQIEKGFLVYVAYQEEDTFDTIEKAVHKVINLRVFSDENDKLNLSIKDIDGEILLVSSFSLYGDASRGNRPSFILSAKKEISEPLYLQTIKKFKESINTESGVFGADMKIQAINDGPISIILNL